MTREAAIKELFNDGSNNITSSDRKNWKFRLNNGTLSDELIYKLLIKYKYKRLQPEVWIKG